MKISVVGTGYVGLVTGTCLAEMGNDVTCVDNSPEKLSTLNNADVPIYEPGLEVLFHRNIAKKRLHFTEDLKTAVNETDVVFLCLPTPQSEDGSADLKYVLKVADDIGKILNEDPEKKYKVLVNKSTVPVGTSKLVENAVKKNTNVEFDVVSNPEFLREGFAVEDFMKPDRIVVGSKSKKALDIMKALYEPFVRQGNPILEMDPESSEMTKYASNSYLAMRITFMNQLANLAEKVGADIDNIRKGMGADSRIGKRFLFAGIGYGGSCFPKDVNALIKTSKENNAELDILTIVDRSNQNQKKVILEKIKNHFNDGVEGKTIAVWGLAFKPNTDDMREAPSVIIINELLKLGAKVKVYDPAAMENSKYYLNENVFYAADEYEASSGADALVILTEWNEFRNPDFDKLKANLRNNLIFDGRNVFSPSKMKELGITYYSIGRNAVQVN